MIVILLLSCCSCCYSYRDHPAIDVSAAFLTACYLIGHYKYKSLYEDPVDNMPQK